MRLIFLDIDGVLNCQLFFAERTKVVGGTYLENNICKERLGWLNELCSETGAKVVISSTWRLGNKLCELQDLFNIVGGTFEIVGYTPNLRHEACVRGNEILQYIKDHEELGYHSDYHDYAIIDDDSDMLLWQKDNFFQTDTYAGLTPNICHKIKRFFEKKPA
jgi:HAD domain in Swiss Army Knife RNA repair proteins